ncbi:MAG: putative metalloprotease CJM1_0395 family protein [Myxococcota bacterium]
MRIGASLSLAFERSARVAPTAPPHATPESGSQAAEEHTKAEQTQETPREDAPGADTVLSVEEEQEVQRLKARDAEVRRHELAHAAVGGPHAGTPTYTFETGPDGRRYAVGGEVQIDMSEVQGDPEASIAKMQIVVRAALAPAEPSPQDRRVAARAQAKIAHLRMELSQQESENPSGETVSGGEASGGEASGGEASGEAALARRANDAYRAAAADGESPESSTDQTSRVRA